MTKQNPKAKALIDAFADFINSMNDFGAAVDSAPVKEADKPTKPAKGGSLKAELEALDLKALIRRAVKAGYDADDLAEADKDEIIEALLEDADEGDDDADTDADEDADDADDTDGDDDEDDEDEDDDDEGDEDDEYTRDELEEMSLAELKAVAKEAGWTTADFRGLDKEGVIDLILDEGDEDEDADEDGDDEDDEEVLTEAELKAMSVAELRELADEYEIDHAGLKKADLIDALLEG